MEQHREVERLATLVDGEERQRARGSRCRGLPVRERRAGSRSQPRTRVQSWVSSLRRVSCHWPSLINPTVSSLLGHSRVTALTGWTQLGRVYPCALLSLRVWQASCSLPCGTMARRAGTPLTNPLGNDKKQDLVNFLRAS